MVLFQHSHRSEANFDVDIEWDLPDLSSVGKSSFGVFESLLVHNKNGSVHNSFGRPKTENCRVGAERGEFNLGQGTVRCPCQIHKAKGCH